MMLSIPGCLFFRAPWGVEFGNLTSLIRARFCIPFSPLNLNK